MLLTPLCLITCPFILGFLFSRFYYSGLRPALSDQGVLATPGLETTAPSDPCSNVVDLQFVDCADAIAFEKPFCVQRDPHIERLVRLLHLREFLFGFTSPFLGFDHEYTRRDRFG